MPVVGFGLDLLHLPRIAAVLARTPASPKLFTRRILTAREQALWPDIPSSEQVRFLGVR